MFEIDALGESNYQLLVVGRNLNQVARRLSEGQHVPITVARIEALRSIIEKHTELVSNAIRAGLERWSITHGTESAPFGVPGKCAKFVTMKPPTTLLQVLMLRSGIR